MELLAFITKNTHDSSLNSLKSKCFCESIYKLLNFDMLNDVAKSLTFMTNSKYIYSGRIIFNEKSNEIEVYYKGADSSFPIYMILSPDESKNNDGLKFSGLSDEIKKLLNTETPQKPLETPLIQPSEPVLKPNHPIMLPENNLSEKVEEVISNLDTIIEKESSKTVLDTKVDNLLKNMDKIIEQEAIPKIIPQNISEKVDETINNIDKIIKEEAVTKKVNKLLENMDSAIVEEKKFAEKELKKKNTKRKINKTISILTDMIDKELV